MSQIAELITPSPLPPWLPADEQKPLAGRTIAFKLPKPIRLRLRQPEKIKVADHARKYRQVTDGPHLGPWRHEYAPHTVKIMNTFGRPWVREVWFCGVEQSGKTNTMLNCMAWAIDCDPGNIFYLMPTEDTSSKITGSKIRPMLQQSPRLRQYLSDRQDDTTLNKIKLRHGVTIFPSWANSPAAMATFAAKHVFGDEVDKYPARAGKEADPITLLKKRNRTYKGRYKRFFSSTPAGMYIYKGMQNCPQVWEFRLRCPHCQELIKPTGEHLVIPEKVTFETVEQHEILLTCPECGATMTEKQREQAIRTGYWYCIKGDNLPRPTKVGFHHRCWDCLDIPLTEIAAAWLLAESGSTGDKVAWANGYEAIDYEQDIKEREEEQILKLSDPSMPRGISPRNPSGLMLIVDTQRIGFYYQVWAYGYGRDLPTWKIDHGFVEHFANIKDISEKIFLDADNKEYRIGAAFIDSGGGTNPYNPKHSRTAEVYEFCRRNPIFRPLKGRREQAQPWNVTKIDFYPSRSGKKIPIPGGLLLYTLNVTHYKNDLAGKLLIEPGDPGAFLFHADIDEPFAKQLCAEYRDERGWWHCPRHKENHHWDISVYGLAAADIMGIKNKKPVGEQGPRRRILSKGVR